MVTRYQKLMLLAFLTNAKEAIDEFYDAKFIEGEVNGKYFMTGESEMSGISFNTFTRNNVVTLNLVDVNDIKANKKENEYYGGIRICYSQTKMLEDIIKTCDPIMQPEMFFNDYHWIIAKAIFSKPYRKLTDISLKGKGDEYYKTFCTFKHTDCTLVDFIELGIRSGKIIMRLNKKEKSNDVNEIMKEFSTKVINNYTFANFIDELKLKK